MAGDGYTFGRSMTRSMLLSSDFDNHLLETWHYGRRAKVSEEGHAIAGAQTQPGLH
jgi:hypothetical protein